MNNKEFLIWVADRIVEKEKISYNTDYVQRILEIAKDIALSEAKAAESARQIAELKAENEHMREKLVDLEKQQTPDQICIDNGCANYVRKICNGSMFIVCMDCTTEIGTPSNHRRKS